ncbi:MAG: flavodoxin [Oscillospiraceae bacterium]|nr:flavodoxin [Oscillospiraceae bacterium]
MSEKLTVYFSCSGITKKVAQKLAQAAGTDLFEIRPAIPYTKADLDWTDKKSRSSVEMSDPDSRPEISEKLSDIEKYDTVFVGFPIWWYVAPTIINTFLESYDFSGKTIIPFATSGSSGMGNTDKVLQGLPGDGVKFKPGKRFDSNVSVDELRSWVQGLGE